MTTPSSSSRRKSPFALFFVGLTICALLTGAYYALLVHGNRYTARDFMSLWGGGRAILDGVNAYDPDSWIPLRAQYGSHWFPDTTAPFPLWTSLMFVPLASASIDFAASFWLAVTTIMIVGSLLLLLYRGDGKPPLSIAQFVALLLMIFLSRPTILVLLTGQLTGLLLLAIALFIVLMQRNQQFLAGLALPFMLLKPNAFVLFAALVGIWLLHRRYWRAIAGSIAGTLLMLAASWAVQPGWISEWLAVSDKAVVTAQTPTVWGVMWELTDEWWPLTGLVATIVITAVAGYFVLTHPDLDVAAISMVALTLSLFTTPYIWAYEHLLLAIPLVLFYRQYRTRRRVSLLLFVLALVVPWLLYWIANQRGIDTYSALTPVLVFGLCAYYLTDKRIGVGHR